MKIPAKNILFSLSLLATLSLLPAAAAQAQAPDWWSDRGVLNTNQPNDYALINHGQLKTLAQNTFLEMDELGVAGTNLAALIETFSNTNNYAPVNIGQLKNLAKPFYDCLYEFNWTNLICTNAMPEGMTGCYPWSDEPSTNNFALANIGQAKYLFSFNLWFDTDEDELPDLWELKHFGNLDKDASGDEDQDGLTNGQEFDWDLDPNLADTDDDGVNDGDEVAQGRDPHAASVSDTTGAVNLKVFTVLE